MMPVYMPRVLDSRESLPLYASLWDSKVRPVHRISFNKN